MQHKTTVEYVVDLIVICKLVARFMACVVNLAQRNLQLQHRLPTCLKHLLILTWTLVQGQRSKIGGARCLTRAPLQHLPRQGVGPQTPPRGQGLQNAALTHMPPNKRNKL